MSQAPGQLDLCITQGLTFGPVTFTLQDSLGDPVNITGWSVESKAKDTTYGHEIDLAPTITDAAAGVITMYKTDEQTALLNPTSYHWDMIFTNTAGEKLGVYIEGDLEIGTSTSV